MCGILGRIDPYDKDTERCFAKALDLLRHRGPDDRGVYIGDDFLFGHRRLSIIDLSERGHQPMVDQESGAVIVFNGEIFNYIELQEDLVTKGCSFRSRTDTEVLLKAYLTWGQNCLKRLNGMWSFAIWDPQKRTFFFSRDRFGIKPFYYCREDRGFAFASEPKALLSLFPSLRVANPETLYRFLALGQLYVSDASFYEGIEILPPAHCAEYCPDSKSFRVWRYWDYPAENTPDYDAELSVDEFEALFIDSVRIRMRSDVPVGVTLSGGLDSTAVLAAANKNNQTQMSCFTSVYSQHDRGEAGWAQKAASPYNVNLYEVEAPKKDWIVTMENISWHMDAPGYSPAVYPLWFLMRKARDAGVPVLLEGQGADEALGGYPQYAVLSFIAELKKAFSSPSFSRLRRSAYVWQRVVRTFTTRWAILWLIRESQPWLIHWQRKRVGAGSVLKRDFAVHYRRSEEVNCLYSCAYDADAVTARLHTDHSRDILPGLLHYGDAISMAHSIESRLPFMDFRIVEWLFSRSSCIKIRNGETKWILRKFLRMNGQDIIANRPDKRGYPTPIERWMAKDEGSILQEILIDPGAKIHQFCQPEKIERLIRYHVRGGRGAGNHLYRLVSTEMWMQRCL